MQKDLNTIVADVREKTPAIKTRAEFEAYKATISGPKGVLTDVMKGMGKVPKEDKPAMGKAINEAKMAVEAAFASVIAGLEAAELAAKIGPAIDPTLPSPDSDSRHFTPDRSSPRRDGGPLPPYWIFCRRGHRSGV